MIFNSVKYVMFLPITVLLYYLTPKKIRNIFLLIASYFFYMSWEPKYAILIMLSTVATWLTGFLVDKQHHNVYRKISLAINIIVNLGILFVFKYFNFFADTLAQIANSLGLSIAAGHTSLLLPVGISFYTFQALFIDESATLISSIMPPYSTLRWLYVIIITFSVALVLVTDFFAKYTKFEFVQVFSIKNSILRWGVYYFFIITIMFCFIMTTNEFGQAGAFIYFQF